MKKVSLLIFVSLILLLVFASCTLLGGKTACEHDWKDATCTTPKTCTKCNATEGEVADHDWADATCLTPKTCKTCELTEGEALGHNWADATCTAPKTCWRCNEQVGSTIPHRNDIVIAGRPATCTKTGLTDGIKCSACNTVTTPQTTIEMTPHTPEVVPGHAASCTATGLTDGSKCADCGTVLTEQETIPLLPHTEETVPGKAPTCTEDGLTDGKKCSVCGTVTVAQTTRPATNHPNVTTVGAQSPTCTEPGYTEGVQCNDCGHWVVERTEIPKLGHTPTGAIEENRVEATCQHPGGYDMVVYCFECGEVIESTHTELPKLDHKFENYEFVPGSASCGVDGKEVAYCSLLCGTTHERTAEGTALEHEMPEDALCGEIWNCVHCGEGIAVREHDMAPATCITLSTCTHCGHTEGELAAHTPGTPVEEDRVEPTCTEKGTYNSVVYCTVDGCGQKISSTPGEIDALGHDMLPATCLVPSTCDRCGVYTEGEPRDNHDVRVSYVEGELKYYCASGCDISFVAENKYFYDGSSAPTYTYNSNGNMPVNFENGYYEYLFTPDASQPKPTVEQVKAATNSTLYGWAYNTNTKDIGAQPMFWFPSNNKNDAFKDFSCANNAFGVVSFRISSGMTADYTVAIAKSRNDSSAWNGWSTSSINLLTIGGVTEGADSITIKGGLDGTNFEMATIPVENGWSEWFEVKLFIHLKSDNTITVGYYINDEFYGSYTRDLKNPEGKNTIDSLDVRALYINGWTYAPGSGLALDDIAFGFTTDSDWYFDECDHNDTVKEYDPTCTEDGYAVHHCSICGRVETVVHEGTALGHDTVHVDAKESTCKEQGWGAFDYCARCEKPEDKKVLLPLADHTAGDPIQENVKNAACEVAGSYEEVVKCSVCGHELSRTTKEIPALEHDYDTVVPGTAATCTAPGLTDGAKCSKCGKEMTAQTAIDPLGHDIVVDPAVDATCAADGKTAGEHCTRCDYEVVGTVIPKDTVPHTYDDASDAECNVCGATRDVACQHTNKETIPAVDATCTTAGSTAGEKCADCGEILTAPTTVAAKGHTEVVDEAVEATCTTAGKTAGKHCSVCGEVLVAQTEIAAKGHTEVTDYAVAPDCTNTGLTEGKHCSVCGEVLVAQETLDAKGHSFADATCDVAKTCTVCGATEGDPLPSHTLTNTLVDGKLVYECSTCDKSFAITHTQYHTDGSGLSGFTFNDPKTNASYAGTTNAPEAITVDGNTYYQFLRDTEHNTTVGGAKATGQATMWIPKYHDSANPGLKNLSAADGSILLISFDVDYAMSNNLTLNLVYGAPSTGETWYQSPLGKIMEAPINFYSQKDAEGNYTSVLLYGWNNVVIAEKTFAADDVFTAFGSTGWLNVQLAVELDAANDMLIGHYYIDGAYVTTQCVENTLENNMITAVQFDGTSVPVNSGYRFDNFAVGYTNGAEWTFDTCEHNYVAGETVAPTCDEDGYTPYTCELCGHVENRDIVEATGHVGGVATCIAAGTCTVCGEGYIPALGHDVSISNNGGKLTYTCDRCHVEYKIETEGVYYDGSDAADLVTNYVGGASQYNNGANKIVSTDGAYQAITDIDAKVNTESQMQIWIPTTKDQTSKGLNFNKLTLANASTGVLSFKLNVKLLKKDADCLSFKIVDNAWGGAGCIDSNIVDFRPVFNNEGVLTGYSMNGWSTDPANTSQALITTIPVGEDSWSGWFDVKAVFTLDPTTGNVTALYYLNDQYVGSGVKKLTTTSQKLACVYINLNAWVAGTGYYIDDLAFGHTASGHWMLDGKEHNFTPATCSAPASCSCGWTGVTLADHNIGAPTYDAATNTVAYKCSSCNTVCKMTGYYFDGSNTDFAYSSNGNMPVDTSNGYYEYVFTPTPGDNGEEVKDAAHGWAQNGSNWGAQPMFWIPTRAHESGLDGFNCENNVSGKISFRIRTNMTNSYNLAIGKEREYSNWNSDGTWSLNYNVLQIGGYSAGGITVSALLNGTTQLATIPVAGDGWSEWFTVEMQISLTDAGKITIDYYINGELKGSATKDQYVVPSTGKYLDIRAIYINGWTFAAGTGLALDDITFAYHTHNTFDGRVHNVTSATCLEKESCSCGWVGTAGAHSFGEGCAPCTLCGASNPDAPHANLAPSYVNGVQYACADCGYAYKPDGGMHNYNDIVNAVSDSSHTYTNVDGLVTYTNTGVANGQHQFWVPGQTESAAFANCTNANNATVFLSFSVNTKDAHNTGVEFKVNANRGQSDWNGPTGSGWSDSSVGVFKVKPHAVDATTVDLTGYNGASLGSIAITGTEGWTGWIDVVIKMQLHTDNTVTVDYYINGAYFKTITADMVIHTYEINSLYVCGRNNSGEGYQLKDLYFGYTTNGMSEYEAPLYKEVIAAENVTSETLTTIVASKIKQYDQCTAVNTQGGTPVYVLAEGKDGTDVEALYFSRTYAWDGNESEQFSEFRFAVNGESAGPAAVSISFDYLARGTVETNDRYEFTDLEGNKFYADAYVQVKTPSTHELAGDNYPELSGTDLTLDGEWHTMTYTFDEPLVIIDILLNLYHFQGELLISNLVITYTE